MLNKTIWFYRFNDNYNSEMDFTVENGSLFLFLNLINEKYFIGFWIAFNYNSNMLKQIKLFNFLSKN